MIDNYIMDQSPRITMTLSEILANTPPVQTLAQATDVPGTNLEWMKTAAYLTGAWYGDLGELGTTGFRDGLFTGYLARGVTCKVSGVPYSWSGTRWDAVGGGGGLPVFASYAELPAPTLGLLAQIPRLCGNGYFALRANGTRWEVCPGESIIRDAGPASAGYDLTATGTAYVALVSYTIPAGLIGDGEEWEGSYLAKNNGTFSGGGDFPSIRIGTLSLRGSLPSIAGANQVCRGRASIVRIGSIFACAAGSATSDLYNQAANSDRSVDLASTQTIDAGFTPGVIGNTMRLRHWAFRRIG